MLPGLFMVFDVESIGLHGQGFSFGYVVVDQTGSEIDSGYSCCEPDFAEGSDAGHEWVRANVPLPSTTFLHGSPRVVRDEFWAAWLKWKARGAVLAADCAWPVEARFLADCVDDDPERRTSEGPYPLLDVATLRLAAGFDPLATVERLPAELPAHDPLADARQSARLVIEALRKLGLAPPSVDPPVPLGDPSTFGIQI